MQRPWLRPLDPELHDLTQKAQQDPSVRATLARALNTRGRHAEAVPLLDQLLAEHRNDADLWFERIIAASNDSSTEELDILHQELESLLVEHPDETPTLRNLGFVRLLQQRTEEAELDIRKALSTAGQDARTLELMGLLALQRDEASEAKGWFLKALTLNPRDARTLRLLGLACEAMGDHKGAEAQFVAALDIEPCYFWGWHSLGELLLGISENEAGFRCIHRARSLCACDPASYFILCELFSEQGHLEMAQAELHALMALAPEASVLGEAYGLLGEIQKDLGDREAATSYFSLAAETSPDNPNPWVALGDLAREDDRLQDALRCYREALARDPEAADVQVQLGWVLVKLTHTHDAEAAFLGALERDPGEYSAYLGLAECYRLNQRPEDQMRMVREAMAIAPHDPDVWNSHGVALEVANDPNGATEAYEKALSFAPTHRRAANNLGFLLEKRMEAGEPGLRERALEAWRRRLLICRDEGQSTKMAREHLIGLGVDESTLLRWLEHEQTIHNA